MTRRLELQEYEEHVWEGHLSPDQLRALDDAHIGVSPATDRPGAYVLRPGPWVGAVNVGDLAVIVRPKILVDRVMFLITYAMDPRGWRDHTIDLAPDDDVLEAVALTFARRTQQAIGRGLLRGYRRREEALHTVRGRIRFGDQIGRRFGLPLPIEVSHNEYTEDIEQNRLLKTAIDILAHTLIRSDTTRRELRGLRPAFDMVRLGTYARGAVPEIRYTRLDEHYRPAVELARLIIENSSLELFAGKVAGAALLINMNRVFEHFLYVALGEALGLSREHWKRGKPIHLDKSEIIRMEPDLSWWPSGPIRGKPRPVFVGDAKYKKLEGDGRRDKPDFIHADIYQMLAYCTAADLSHGLLVYAAGEGEPGWYEIEHAGKTIEVESLNLSGAPVAILDEVDRLAKVIRTRVLGSVHQKVA